MRVEQVDVAVVGAGPAGLTAAAVAAQNGARVLVVDESPTLGGRLVLQLNEEAGWGARRKWRRGTIEARRLADIAVEAGVRVLAGTTVWGIFPGWELYLGTTFHRDDGKVPDLVRAPAVIVATGAAQNPLAIPGWTLAGVFTVGAAQALINVYRVLPGTHAVIVGVDPLALMIARQLSLAGVEVRAVLPPGPSPYVIDAVDPKAAIRNLARFAAYAPSASLRLIGHLLRFTSVARLTARLHPSEGLSLWGIPLMLRRAVTAVEGSGSVSSVRVATLGEDGTLQDNEERWSVDTVVTSAGLFPLVELVQAAGCPLVHVPELGGHVPLYGPDLQTPISGLFVAGSVTGVAGWPVAVAQGRLAGIAAVRYLGPVSLQMTTELERARAAVTAAWQRSLPLTQDPERGLATLAQAWTEAAHA